MPRMPAMACMVRMVRVMRGMPVRCCIGGCCLTRRGFGRLRNRDAAWRAHDRAHANGHKQQ